jgi:hypothetical protein
MSSGWFAIPYAAEAAVTMYGPSGQLALMDLYKTGNLTGYSPRPWTEVGLAQNWGCSRTAVVNILRALEGVGAVELLRSAPRQRLPSTLIVRPPMGANQNPNQNPNQSSNQKDEPAVRVYEDAQPVVQPVVQPVTQQPRARSSVVLKRREQQEQQDATSQQSSDGLFRESTTEPELHPAKKPASKKPKPASNPWTDAWSSAWKACSGGNAYPWAGSYHRCSALSKALPNASLDGAEERMTRAIKGGVVTFERWAVREKEEVLRRQVSGPGRESVADLVGLFDPEPPTVEQKRPYTVLPSQDTADGDGEPIAPRQVTPRPSAWTPEEREEVRRKREAYMLEVRTPKPAPPGAPGPRRRVVGEK